MNKPKSTKENSVKKTEEMNLSKETKVLLVKSAKTARSIPVLAKMCTLTVMDAAQHHNGPRGSMRAVYEADIVIDAKGNITKNKLTGRFFNINVSSEKLLVGTLHV